MPGKFPFTATALALFAALLTACGSDPAPAAAPSQKAGDQAWYPGVLAQLTDLNRAAETLFKNNQPDQAAALIQRGEPLASRLLSVPRPTLEATEAAADLDQLYGRMLLSNHRYGWARLQFQKNLARWKHWQPQTPETERRLKLAQASIAECDKHISQ